MQTWQTISSSLIGRHSHRDPYVSIVLSGGYEEAGDHGRFLVSEGDVILHDEFEAHLNRIPRCDAIVLNLPLDGARAFIPGVAKISNPDLVVRISERDKQEAVALLFEAIVSRPKQLGDWPDNLVQAMQRNPDLRIQDWASRAGIRPWTVTRGFRQVFGITPEAFRLRCRARLAWKLLGTEQSLAIIASSCGFFDQAHMSRSVKALTGQTPKQGRYRANGYKTQIVPVA